jgi:hypothetical protein
MRIVIFVGMLMAFTGAVAAAHGSSEAASVGAPSLKCSPTQPRRPFSFALLLGSDWVAGVVGSAEDPSRNPGTD